MIDIIFNTQSVAKPVAFRRVSEHVVSLVGIAEQNTSGFKTYRHGNPDKQLGDFSDYKTVYRTSENEIQFSNDGSVYVPIPEPTPEEKAMRERITRVAELKRKLADTDYCVIKIAEGEATKEEYSQVLADRKVWRREINELENS